MLLAMRAQLALRKHLNQPWQAQHGGLGTGLACVTGLRHGTRLGHGTGAWDWAQGMGLGNETGA